MFRKSVVLLVFFAFGFTAFVAESGQIKPLLTPLKGGLHVKLPTISNVRLVESNRKRKLYDVVWDIANASSDLKGQAILLKNGAYYCDVRSNFPITARKMEISMADICQNRPEPRDEAPVYQIQVSVKKFPSVKATTKKMRLPIYPDYRITSIERGRQKSGSIYFYYYVLNVKNDGLVKGNPATVRMKIIDLDTHRTAILNSTGNHLLIGDNRIVFGYRVYDPLINTKHQRVEVIVDPENKIKEYDESNNFISAEFYKLTRIR